MKAQKGAKIKLIDNNLIFRSYDQFQNFSLFWRFFLLLSILPISGKEKLKSGTRIRGAPPPIF